jgi:signal transduction histidine kinase/GAF domain-containing protein
LLMWVLTEASRILSTPLGSLVYHLVLLLAIEAALGMAWEEWRRTRRMQAQRLLFAAGGLALVRLVYVIAALIAMAGWVDRTILLPPLERFADTASLALLAWAVIPTSPTGRRVRAWNLVLTANLILVVAACIAATILWSFTPTPDYNLSWQATVWSVWQIILALLAGLAILSSRGEGWIFFLLAMIVILVGQSLQMLFPTSTPHLPIWERLANLIAYPLLVIAVYQNIIVGLHLRSRQFQDISQASMDQIKSLLFLFEASREMSNSLDPSTVLDNAAQGIARALDADQCAIAFPQDNDPGQMRLAAIYNPARQGRGEGVAFPLDYQLAVRQAMRRKRYVTVEEADNVQLKVLFALLGSSDIGPLLIQPLLADNEAIGAIIVGNARSRRPFTANEAKLCQSMADQVVGAIQNARRHHTLQAKIEELGRSLAEERRASQQAKGSVQELADRLAASQATMDDLKRREEAASEARNALEIRLVSSRAESESLTDRLSMVESDLAQTHANAEAQLNWHKMELARQEAAWQEAILTQERLQATLNGLTAGIIVADSQGRIQEANVAAEILLDFSSGQLKGTELRAINNGARWQQAMATAGGGEAVRLTLPVGANTLLCDVAPLPGDASDNLSDGIVAIIQDISTETDEQQGRQKQIAAKAQDLRNSVATAINYANLILSDATGMAGTKFMLRLRSSVERMAQMADEVIHLTTSSPARLQPVDVNQIIQAAVTDSQFKLKDKALAVDLALPDALPTIDANPDDLRQVLSNLLLNAYLASPTGGRIRVQASRSNGPSQAGYSDALVEPGQITKPNGDGFVIISVRDCGGGLSDEALDHLFDRAGSDPAGADLALVKTLIEAHRGRVWVETEAGVGTTFTFALPVEGHG